ncbi:MAG TPA: platelet-activating factor acetylhydrolase IB subunit [Pirellulales bacterium]|jgi:lysophospholipase L1-like esterase|nr:platelet-activating factor acetylhydrolase IB subunit [Pirellulales bacterium]
MKRLLMTTMFALLFAVPARADNARPNTAAKPAPRDPGWVKRHEGFVEIAKKGGVDLLFLGDSITDGWRGRGKEVWAKNYEPLKAANFGIGGDRTQHVLWRLQNGELDGIKPKLAVLMIGTNNLGSNTDEEIVDGIKAIIEELHTKSPETKLLLLGIFPRSMKADDKARARIKHINSEIAKLDDDGKTIKYLDIGNKFLEPDGTLPKSIMPDSLHPNAKGYEIWAEAINPTVKEMMK